MTTHDILMDFLCKFEGNSRSIHRKFAQKRRKWISNTCLFTGLVVIMPMVQVGNQVDDKSPNGKSGLKAKANV